MSRIGYIGRSFRILYRGEILAAVRTKAVNHIRAAIDCSDEERDGWRHLDPRYESSAVEISAEGVATAANYALLEQDWLGNTFTDLVLVFPDGSIELAEDGAYLNSLTFGGEVGGAVSFEASWTFSGRVTTIEEILLTSWHYSYVFEDTLRVPPAIRGGRYEPHFFDELDVEPAILGGTLEEPVVEYDDWPDDELDVEPAILGGDLFDPLVEYDDWPDDELDVEPAILGGELADVLVEYDN